MNRRVMRWLAVGAISLIPISVLAQEQSIVHSKDSVHTGNYIRAARTIQVDGKVTRDVVVVGRNITLTGPIDGDAIVVGQTVIIHSPISGNLRVIGQDVTIDGSVGKNVTIAASTVTVSPGTKVGWDVSIAAQIASIAGTIDGGLWVRGQDVELAGSVKDAADIGAGGKLIVRPTAKVGGTLAYQAPKPSTIPPGAAVGTTQYRPAPDESPSKPSQAFFWPIVFLFGAWVVGGALLAVAEPWLNAAAERVRAKPAVVLGWGVVGLVIPPVLSVILAVTLIGIPLGALMMAGYVVTIYAAKIIAGYMIAHIAKLQSDIKAPSMLVMIVGVAVYVGLLQIPFVGAIVGLFGALLTFGVIVQSLLKRV